MKVMTKLDIAPARCRLLRLIRPLCTSTGNAMVSSARNNKNNTEHGCQKVRHENAGLLKVAKDGYADENYTIRI